MCLFRIAYSYKETIMPIDVIMPKMGLTMTEGAIVRWFVSAGDPVRKGQVLFQVETDKVVVDVEAQADGIMGPILVGEQQKVPITTVVARLYEPGETPEPLPPQAPATTKLAAEAAPAVRATPVAERMAQEKGVDLYALRGSGAGQRITARDVETALTRERPAEERRQRLPSSPRARALAREYGIDWQTLPGSGPGGRVVEQDVLRAVADREARAKPAPEEAEVTWATPTTIQRIAAERMAASFGTAPHFYLTAEVMADRLLDLRERLMPLVACTRSTAEGERSADVHLTVTDILIKIVATALVEQPKVNAFWQPPAGGSDTGRIALHRRVNIAVAVATDGGLITPVIHDADRKSLSEIAVARADLVNRTRAGRLEVKDISGGTFTLSNLGMHRIDIFQAILNPPQAAILAVGRIVERPVALNGELAVRPTLFLTLSCDHRVLDGAVGALFLERISELIEEPYGLLA
jgi:pyruvate dehydrogenase E2 component (dihydrolipoamide acetyltransferase)